MADEPGAVTELDAAPARGAPEDHLVVGIGASAGGLAALKPFLAEIPPGAALALVVVQHGAPGDRPLLPEVLGPLCALPVEVIGEGTPLQPGRLYVAPGDTPVEVRRGRCRPRRPRNAGERRSPVDALFRALAEAHGAGAVGVVLSGMGSDGALGAVAIAAAGGMVLVQEPATAAHPEMPESAIATGCVDTVDAPAGLARALLSYARHLRRMEKEDAHGRLQREIEAHLPQIADLMRARTGHDFKHYKTSTMVRRLRRRLQVLRLDDPSAYLALLERDPAEAQTLFRELLIGVTGFFRDPEAFEALDRHVLAPLLEDGSTRAQVRIWVPGCATGEEAYSIAMLVQERLDRLERRPEVQIFATDVDEKAIAVARRGSYPLGIAEQVPPERLQRFFARRERRYQVAKELRAMCLFSAHNLIADPPFSRLDLISCRNLLIYLGPHLQQKLISLFHYALRPGGYLFLGASESLAGHGDLFRPVDPRHRIAQRKDAKIRVPGQIHGFAGTGAAIARAGATAAEPHDLGAVAQRILLDEFAPPYVLVGEAGRLVFQSEGVDKFLQPPPGAFTDSVLRMARAGLGVPLRAALAEAGRRRRTVIREIASVQTQEGPRMVRLTVQPMPEMGHEGSLYMLVFEDLGTPLRRAGGEGQVSPEADAIIRQLEQELLRTRDELERTVQELEQANEELKSSNEELRSINEELQSANEELETGKEEVQAANRALAAANADLENLLRSTRIATIFLDREGSIRSFTPAASEIYNITSGDVGRPLAHFTHRLREPPPLPAPGDLAPDAAVGDAVETLDGRWFLRRVLPYRTAEGTCDGLVVTFVDITRQKQAEERLRENEAQLRLITDAMPVLISYVDAEQRYRFNNRTYEDWFGRKREEIYGRHLQEVLGEAAYARVRPYAERALAGESVTYEALLPYRHGGTRYVEAEYVPHVGPDGRVLGYYALVQDITRQKQAEERLRESEADLRSLFDLNAQVPFTADPDGRVLDVSRRWLDWTGLTREEALGEGWTRVPHPDDLPSMAEAWKRSLATGEPYDLENRVRLADGSYRWMRTRIYPRRDETGRIVRWYGTTEDIDDRKRAEAALRESERRLNAVLDNATVAVFLMDERQHCVYMNAAAEKLTGYTLAETQGRPLHDVLHHTRPDGRPYPLEECPIDRAFPEDMQEQGEEVFVHKDGSFYPVAFTASPIHDERANVVGTIVEVRDIRAEKAAQAALRESEGRFRRTADTAPAMLWVTDAESRCIYLSRSWYELTGQTPATGLGFGWLDAVHPDDRDRAARAFLAAVAERESFELEHRLRRADGSYRWVIDAGRPLFSEAGEFQGYVGSVIDIHDRKEAQERLRASETRLRDLVATLDLGTFMARDLDGTIRFWSAGCERLFGWSAAEAVGQPAHDLLRTVFPVPQAEVEAALERDGRWTGDLRQRTRSGREIVVAVHKVLRRDADGRPTAVLESLTDVTAQRRIETALAESEARFRAIVETSHEGIWLVDTEARTLFINERMASLLGRPAAEIIGRPVPEFVFPDDVPAARARVGANLVGEAQQFDFRFRRSDGSELHVLAATSPMRDAEGNIVGALGMFGDLTDRRRAQEALRESEERLRLAIEVTGLGIFDVDPVSGMRRWSAEFKTILGLPQDTRPDPNLYLSLIHPEDRDWVAERYWGSYRGEHGGRYDAEYRILRASDGAERWVYNTGQVYFDADGRAVRAIGTLRDITDRKHAEEALRESEARLDLAVRAHGIGIFDWHVPTGRVVWSEQEERLFGLEPGTFEGDIAGWAERLLPPDLARMQAAMAACMARREPSMDFEFRIRRADGAVRHIEGSARFLYAADGTPLRMVGINIDVTERKEAEERQRLLLAELSHRVKNTLAVVIAVARQTSAGATSVPGFRDALEGRLQALAAAHELLTATGWRGARLSALVEKALLPHGGADRGRFEVQVADLRLKPAVTQSLTLALHELATNAGKHGALSTPHGRVVLTATVAGKGSEAVLDLVWRERGGPAVTPPARNGFGSTLLQRAIAYQHKGRVDLDWRPEGLVCRIRLPLAEIVEPSR